VCTHLPTPPLGQIHEKVASQSRFHMPSRMAMVAIVSLLVCALAASTSVNANVWQTDEDAFVSANKPAGVNGNMERQQKLEFIGHRPRLASFNRASEQGGGRKRTVPGGPNPITHHAPTSPGPSNPIDPPHHGRKGPPPSDTRYTISPY
jgi:hypothetical protein